MRMPNFGGLLKFKSTRARNLVIILAIVIVVVALFAVYLLKQPGVAEVGGAKLTRVPQDVRFEPGAKDLSKEYLKTLMQSEQLKYEQAVKTGTSAIPTFVETGDQEPSTGSLFTAKGQVCPPSCYQLINERYAQYKTPTNLLAKWVKEGRLLPATAAELDKLDKQSQSEAEYAAALNQLVKEGKLTPEQARQLLEAYRREHHLLGTGESTDDLIDQMVGAGQLSPEDAANLRRLVDQGVPVKTFKDALDSLVAANRLAKEPADQLLKSYEKQKGIGVDTKSPTGQLINQLEANGDLPPDIAKALHVLNETPVSAADFEKALNRLVAQGKISPEVARRLLAAYRAEHPETQAAEPKSALAQFEQEQRAREQREREEAARQAAAEKTQAEREQEAEAAAATVKAVQTSMTAQVQSLITAWNPVPQKYVFAPIPKSQQDGKVIVGPDGRVYSTAGSGQQQIPLIKAGSILFAVLDTGVNSDQPGPVMATIVNGKYKGAKLIGALTQTPDGERVVLEFTQMSQPDWADVIPIKAVAINPDTARTAIASNVNHHYLLRYGSLFASSFVQGLSKAVEKSGSTNVSDENTTTTTHPKLNTREQLYMAIGQVGENFSDVAKKQFDRKPTVKVDAGVGLGILFTGSVYRYPLQPVTSKTESKGTST